MFILLKTKKKIEKSNFFYYLMLTWLNWRDKRGNREIK